MKQDNLRNQVKLAKVCSDITYKQLAQAIDIRFQSFYNWMNGAYDLSYKKAKELQDIVIDFIDQEYLH